MSSQEEFVHRAGTVIITLSEVIQDFSEPERLLLKLSKKTKKKALDVGSLAYFMSGKNESTHDGRSTPVVISSFVKGRRELVVRLLESFAGLRDQTVLQMFIRTKYFINWLNSSGYRELFASEVQAQEAYRDFTSYLNHRMCMRELKPRSANQYQDGAIGVIKWLYPESFHYVLSGAIRIISGRGSAVPSDSHVQLYKDVCLSIAQQCSEFVLNFSSYPCVVSIRDYEVVLFPSHVGAIGPFKEHWPVYNTAERRIATAEEYIATCAALGRKPLKKSCIAKVLRGSVASLAVSNKDERHWHRLYLASLAAKAYAVLFMLITGASPTEFSQFTYEDALEVEKSPLKKELSAVKFRANGKATIYNVGRENGLPLLKEYLKLREWILNGETFDRLFFSTPKLTPRKDRQWFGELPVTAVMRSFYESISGVFLDPNVPNLSARKMRKHKSIVQHSARLSPAMVSASLNHTEAVNVSIYAEATPEQQKSEFGQFWQSVRHAATMVLKRSDKSSGEVISTAAGHCDAFNQPALLSDHSASVIEPNCRTQYGCLYCEHYVCHSDEEDLHKLMSLQYVISTVRNAAPDMAHAEDLYKELSIKIEFIIDAFCERSESVEKMVETVKAKVFEYGILTPFWEIRLGRYERMGLVI